MLLQHIRDNVYYLPGASNIGLVVGEDKKAFLIDTGIGQRSGRQLLQILNEQRLKLAAILNTHGHGDHTGGNAYLVERTGTKIYAPLYDAIVLQHPTWGSMCVFGGAEPITELSTPRFAPQPCTTDVIVVEGELQIAGVTIQVVPLPGHTGSHTGYIVNDVFFTGDILAGEAELANTTISYAYSITKRLDSLERLRHFSCSYYVQGHGPLKSDIADLIERNIAQVMDVLHFIQSYLAQAPAEASEILKAVCEHYKIEMRNIREYYLFYSTLHAYLSHLHNQGQIAYQVKDNHLLWYAIG